MDEAEQQRRIMLTKSSSSIKRKPLGDITNIIRKPYNQSKIPGSSPASDSSIGSTPNPIHSRRPISSPSGHLVGDENQIVYAQRQNTRNKTKADVPFYTTSIQETRNDVKERYVPLCSSTLAKVKDQGKVNQSCLDKTTNDGKKMSVVPRYSSMENVKDKRKAADMPSSTHHMMNTKNNMNTPNPRSALTIKDKGKEIVDVATAMPNSSMKKMDKGKAIAVPLDYSSMRNVRNNMVEVRVPLKGVVIQERGEPIMGSNYSSMGKTNDKTPITMPNSLMKKMDKGKAIAMPFNNPFTRIKDRGETVSGSSCVDIDEKDKGKTVVTPIGYRNLEKKDKRGSCPPHLRTTVNRNKADGAEDIIQFKSRTEPPPNKKIRRCSSKEEYALPQDYVEQQRAYFKEIDDFELEVEEV